jgi:GTPase SAR1 family protein
VIIFDITKKETFVNLSKWIQTVQMRASVEQPPIIVLGNKADIDKDIEVDDENIEKSLKYVDLLQSLCQDI